jgi:hypothetical protein
MKIIFANRTFNDKKLIIPLFKKRFTQLQSKGTREAQKVHIAIGFECYSNFPVNN